MQQPAQDWHRGQMGAVGPTMLIRARPSLAFKKEKIGRRRVPKPAACLAMRVRNEDGSRCRTRRTSGTPTAYIACCAARRGTKHHRAQHKAS